MTPFRDEDFKLKEDALNFGLKADNIIKKLYLEGESLGYDYRDICYMLSYLIHTRSRIKLYEEEIEKEL